MYDGIIFDQDGILLDSGINKFHWMAEIRAKEAQKKGFDFKAEDAKYLVEANSSETVKEFLDRKNMDWQDIKELETVKEETKIQKIKNGEIELFSGVKNTLSSLDIQSAMVTNAPRMSTSFVIDHFNIEKNFGAIKAPALDDIKRFYDRKKPKPVMIQEARDKLGLENPIMVGDTSSDIKAAKNAGIDSIHINSYGFGTDVEPTYTADSIKEVPRIVREETMKSDTV